MATPQNPFRTPHLTPQNTSSSSSAAPPPQASLADAITEDAPPAYTPAADPGESTVEMGPRRPFQRAPPPPTVPPTVPPASATPPRSFYGETSSGAANAQAPWHQYPGAAAAQPTPSAGSFSPPPGRPPPRHPATASASASLSPRAHTPPPERFAPPPGQPPRRAVSSASSRPTAPAVPDDGRPTTTPTPGHPLLRDGRMLVFPPGFSCHKCANTGYKNFDPSHPCRKCWERYAKQYAGALVYAPRAGAGTGEGNFQRPLPKFRPPHASRAHQHPTPPPPPAPTPVTIPAHPFAPPPPGATVVLPGDPRIGGRLCWRCGGRGTVSFMIFDQETCEVCRGMGRVFN